MKKVFKSISVLVLSLALTVSGLTFVQTAKADEVSDWQANAVKTPTSGSLVGAGYIDVEFDNSLEGYTYEVFLDGNPVYWKGRNIVKVDIGESKDGATRKTFTSNDTPKTEVYTTSVAKHTITVKATKGGDTITSNAREFFVSKKGLAMGDNMGTKVSLQKLNCSWYYNWGTKGFNNSIDNNVPHIPMMWGGYKDSIEDIQNLSTSSNYILGFNEPDIESQSNMGFWEAIDTWNDYINPLSMRKVSPGPAAPGGDSIWLSRFMGGDYICHNTWLNDGSWGLYYDYMDDASKKWVAGVAENVDSVALHYYLDSMNLDKLKSAVNTLWETYHKPIWVTEIGLFGRKGMVSDMSYDNVEKRNEIKQYVENIVNTLDGIPYVERYCWFPYDVDSTNDIDSYDGSGATAMFEYATGLYTELGKMYSSIGNPQGYSANTILDSESFDWDNRVQTDISYDKYTDKLKVSWTNGALNNLSKVDVLIDGKEYSVDNGAEIDTSSFEQGKHSVHFILYNNANEVIIKKTRAFNIKRDQATTHETTTNQQITEQTTNNKDVVTTQKYNNQVKPAKVVLSKPVNVKKKSVKLKWRKTKNTKKYKVQWALNKKFTKKLKIKITTTNFFKVKNLKKKKTYFFRVAAMNDVGIGSWSKIKKIKIKK